MSDTLVADVHVPHPNHIYLGGEWVPATGDPYTVVSPTTEQPVIEVTLPSVADAKTAVALASGQGWSTWATRTVDERVRTVERFCAALERRLPEMERLWAVEAGMPVRYSRTLHKYGAVGAWRTALAGAGDVLRDEVRDSPLGPTTISREPAGVVVGIMSYNGPVVTMASKVIPALLAGCPVIVKAAMESQLVMRVVSECAAEAEFPAGALSIMCGDADLGRTLTRAPQVDVVSLTGGRVAAQEIIEGTRERFARTHLELGGKSPALILPDASMDSVLRSLVPGATSGTGQVCALLSRVLVPESRHDEILGALKASWHNLVIGDPLDPQTQIGPLTTQAAIDRTEQFLSRAVEDGAEIVTGGGRPGHLGTGRFFEPTLVTHVARTSELARNEVFGPITAVLTYADEEDGIRLANDTTYGLASTIYTSDPDRGAKIARRIRAGSVAVNTYGPTLTAPFGGMKASGWGREAGPEGIAEFTELKQTVVATR